MIVAAMLMTSGIVLGQYLGAAMEAEERRKGEKVGKVVNCLHI